MIFARIPWSAYLCIFILTKPRTDVQQIMKKGMNIQESSDRKIGEQKKG